MNNSRIEAVESNHEYCGAAAHDDKVTFGDRGEAVWTDASRSAARGGEVDNKPETRMDTGFA
jgi:hypothetical protein